MTRPRLRGPAPRLVALLLAVSAVAGCAAPTTTRPSAGGSASDGAPPASSSSPVPSSTATPSPVDPAVTAAEAALAGLDARQRAAQLLVVGVAADDLDDGDALLAGAPYGGVFLQGRSSASASTVAASTVRWAEQARAAGRPAPWVAVDQEGGQVQTLRGEGFGRQPSAHEQGRAGLDVVSETARATGASLRSAGITLDLAPVADVVPAGTERANTPIGRYGRQFAGTAPEVAQDAGAVVEGLGTSGVVATVKHFPGLGLVTGNTDTAADVRDGETTAADPSVTLFGDLAALPEHPFVMVSSATYEQIDPTSIAAFSPVVVDQLLRGTLGVDGVVISDDLGQAKALAAVPVGERATRFLAAGGTLVLTVDPSTAPTMLDAVVARAASDPAFAAQVDDAALTALVAKARAGLLP